MTKTPRVRLWAREDGEQPKAIALDALRGPGPGKVYDVQAQGSNEARRTLALFLSPEPDEQRDAQAWLAWRAANRSVREVLA